VDAKELGAHRTRAGGRRSRRESGAPNPRSMCAFKGYRPDPSPSMLGPPRQQNSCPLARTPAKQPPTRVTPRSPWGTNAQRLRTVMMALSHPSHRPRCSHPLLCPCRHDGSNRSDGTPKATTATITNKSSRVSLQLTHELGGYIRRMRSRAPTENSKNASYTKTHRWSLSATPQLPLRLGDY
jgi:hypothetical protein